MLRLCFSTSSRPDLLPCAGIENAYAILSEAILPAVVPGHARLRPTAQRRRPECPRRSRRNKFCLGEENCVLRQPAFRCHDIAVIAGIRIGFLLLNESSLHGAS